MAVQFSGSTAYHHQRWPISGLVSLALSLAVLQVGCSSINSLGSRTSKSCRLVNYELDIPLLPCKSHLARAEEELSLGDGAEQLESDSCVDHYYQAAKHAWLELVEQVHIDRGCKGRAYDLYKTALCALLQTAIKYERLKPQEGLTIKDAASEFLVPIAYCGFVRPPEDFSSVECVGAYSSKKLDHIYRSEGVGTAVIVSRCHIDNSDFRRDRSMFSATVLLRNNCIDEDPRQFALEFCDPLRVESTEIEDVSIPIERDLSVPFAKMLASQDGQILQSFLRPGQTKPDEAGLFMIEPYQKGKIPVLFVHGLLSDRLTWASMLNEMIGRSDLMSKYQPWNFEYPTGEPFLKSAADLRKQLCELLHRVDPDGTDPMLRQIVLVGHSMGGLISSAQITSSEDYLWSSIANEPFENVIIPERYRDRLHSAFFFEPSAAISRVVYIGTPHRGSSVANRAIGKLGSLLIQEPASQSAAHQRLIAANPGVFKNEFQKRLPTSVDMLSPDSVLLQTLRTLPRNPCVTRHSIIGDHCWTLHDGLTDGVVAISSARIPDAASEAVIEAEHTKLTQDPYVMDDVFEILEQHYQSIETTAAF